jgi:hypothetical protein
MAGKNGGARPGAGRKKKETLEEQLSRRDVLLEVFTVAEWREIARTLLDQAKGGNLMILLPYLPYLLGSPRQEIAISGRVEHVKITEIRQALGIVDIRELNAPRKASGE